MYWGGLLMHGPHKSVPMSMDRTVTMAVAQNSVQINSSCYVQTTQTLLVTGY